MDIRVPDFDPELMIFEAESIARGYSGMSWTIAVQTVLEICCNYPELFPSIKSDSRGSYTFKWLKKYFGGYSNRPSNRISNRIGTVPDQIIDVIIESRLNFLDEEAVKKIQDSHRLSMSAENILGLLLEEYLAEKLEKYGWYCAWGETMNKIDFCTERGQLLQVKNRSNSENSSSSSVRKGTEILKWHRVNAKNGVYLWKNLNELVQCCELSETDFSDFVTTTITNNPAALYIENSWLQNL